jgi:spore germination protein GerM
LQEKLSKNVNDDLLVLASSNTRINSMYLGDDGIAYIDFSAELVTEMNVGAGYEGLILQAITNTVGNYYGTDEVYITVDGKPYESGHLLMMEGETFQVDMSRVIR